MSRLLAKLISYRYPGQMELVLEQISLEIRPGELLILLGANGAGKSTLLRSLAGQITPDSGDVFIDQINLQAMPRRLLAQHICLVPQFETTDSHLTVRDLVQLGRAPHRGWWLPLTLEDRQATDDALRRMQLTQLENRPTNTLSGGQWRRMILARALAQRSQILLMDEPTAGLDLKYQYEVLTQLHELAKRDQIAVAVSLHDLNLASSFADRIAILHQGRIAALGTPSEVLTPNIIRQTFGIEVVILSQASRPIVVPKVEMDLS